MSINLAHGGAEELIQTLSQYEEHHPVDKYRVNGWHVWPMLRMWIREQVVRPYAFETHADEKEHGILKASAQRMKGYASQVFSRLGPYFDQGDVSPGHSRSDVVIVTYANRRQQLGRHWFHYIADPISDELKKVGLDSAVWEMGEPRTPRYHVSSRIDTRLEFAVRLMRKSFRGSHVAAELPEWFDKLSTWTIDSIGWKFEWSRAKKLIERLEDESRVIERWLRQTGSKCVFVDPWYSWTGMSASLACSRLGIPSIDLQHGMQGRTHLCYAHWKKVPEQGYEVVPDYFWFWGEEDAHSFEVTNNHSSIPVIGGNIWLNWWREGYSFESEAAKVRELSRGSVKAILVTLQPEIDLDLIAEAVRRSNENYCWFIRLHRASTEQMEQLTGRFEALGHPNVVVEEATQLPLYALFQAVDAHVTGFSTCALEALAFGMPTVVTHQRAQAAYEKYLDKGVMLWAKEPRDVLRGVGRAEDVSPEHCRGWAEKVFAPPEQSEEAIQRIAAYCTRLR